MTHLEQAQARRTEQHFSSITIAARRELAALAALDGRTWDQAPSAWIERQAARFDRWSQCILLLSEQWDALAAEDITASVNRYHQETHHDLRNPFHPRTLDQLDAVVQFATDHRGVRDQFADVVHLLPPLTERLSPPAIEQFIRAEISRRQAVAADPALLIHRQPAELHAGQQHRAGENWLIIEHPASGLRARFHHHPDNPQRHGTIFAKPYKIESIDPNRREEPEDRAPRWRDYSGLGIGTLIYRRAAHELPDVRWGGTSASQYAQPLRDKLHTTDPWRWRSQSCTCAEVWNSLTRETADQIPHHIVLAD